ncbi:MAG: FlgD immunoglobulin-like domain containing protein [bacterium]
MKKPFVALLCLIGAAAMVASSAFAQTEDLGIKLVNAKMVKEMLSSRAARLSVSAGPDPDSVYVGKSFTNHTAADNYWNIYTGVYLPGVNDPNNAYWDWDNSVGIQAADSLQGWWPMHRQWNSAGGLTLADNLRPWWALDHGNVANYVLSQNSAAKRTFGIVGMWHADPGKNAGNAVPWTPLSGTKSAWCGLRQHGDNSVVDAVTGNPFNQYVVWGLHDATTTGGGSGNRFPGYPDQIDQMLYRDIAITSSQSLTVSFLYRTRMSTSFSTTAASRTGWFHGDPLAVTAGNFISSTAAGAAAPQDSFMVYVGAPVDDNAVQYSDGVVRPVYDKQRRWFSEVIKVFGAGNTHYQIFGATGNNPADTAGATPAPVSVTVPSSNIAAILSPAASGNVRLVFRCKTNRGFADSDSRGSGYTSFGYGAVLIDDVTIDIGAGPVVIGDFEGAEQSGLHSIDNRFDGAAPAGVNTVNNWRSTGKPPGEYMHVEALSNLTYNDLCGPSNSPARICNIGGLVITVGNKDDGENAGDSRFTAFREISHNIMSPTINLVPGPAGVANSMGISATIRQASDDIAIWYDMYAGMFNLQFQGNTWAFGSQAYPAIQPNGAEIWGQPKYPGFIVFNPEPQCFTDYEGFIGNGQPIATSRAGGIPDSLRFFLAHQQQCFRFAISLGCNSNEGGYFDNATLVFIDIPGAPGQASAGSGVALGGISGDIWQFAHDTFPANETPGLPGTAAFDTTTGLIRTGINNAQSTGNVLRFDIPADSTVVVGGNATVTAPDDPALGPVRVDMVFRILPGPGNYDIASGRSMAPGGVPSGTLLKVPTVQGDFAVAGDASFWGQFMANPGEVSAGTHNGGLSWDPLTWNSARCDTAQLRIFPVGGAQPTGTGLTAGSWMSMLHEADPKYATLGVAKNQCFVVDTTKAGSGTNVTCNGTVPAWLTTVPQTRTGWDGLATTLECSKIIPDGLLTPGSHVQYFFRKSHAIDPLVRFSMVPDTNFITPQNGEGNSDQHRWQQFSVLPDRWKASAFGGAGAACMLYIDLNDRRGNEGRFVSTMDSLGATAAAKRGSHNGWTAPGTTLISNLDVRTDLTVAVSNKNAQPGSTWDMYGVKASESLTTSAGAPGSRLANRTGLALAAGRESKQGPTPEMLRTYYRVVAVLSGDLTSGILGPFTNRSQDDIALFSDYLTNATGSAQPRGMFIQGDGFGQSEVAAAGIIASHGTFLTDRLGADFRNPSYQSISGNTNDCADILSTTSLTNNTDIYGVSNFCVWSNDVWQRNPAYAETIDAAFYENVGINGPYVSDVVKPATALRNWVAGTSGYEIEHLYSRYCDTNNGRLAYYYHMLNTVFGGICQITGAPSATLDTPQGNRAYTNFMKIGNSVMKQGTSSVRLSVAKAGRVQVSIYDVTGRKIRNLADKVFNAGEHTIMWDGSDDNGSKVARGVYFVRSSVAKDAGRIIVLN